MRPNELVEELRNARQQLLREAEGLPVSLLRKQPSRNEWSIIEILAHLIDVDYYYLSQALTIRDDPGHMFVYFDDERWKAEHFRVLEEPIDQILRRLRESHDAVQRAVSQLTEDELQTVGAHPTRGTYTVRDALLRFPTHDRNHAEQVRSVRQRLGA